MELEECTSRDMVFQFLDNYANNRRNEISNRKMTRNKGLIKSYWLESQVSDETKKINIEPLFASVEWSTKQLGDSEMFQIHTLDKKPKFIGVVEPLNSRHIIIHSVEDTQKLDSVIRRAVFSSSDLDFAWLSGKYFQMLWKELILPQYPDRFVRFKFEHEGKFERWENLSRYNDDYDNDGEISNSSSSGMEFNDRSSSLASFFSTLQQEYSLAKAIKMFSMPAQERGNYDFWSWGKVTYRSPQFSDGLIQIRSIANIYQKATEEIEKRVWLQAEKTKLLDNEQNITLNGTPVTIRFDKPLTPDIFQNFVKATFEEGNGPFRLWGKPIRFGENKIHVYGIDLHLWQRIYFEMNLKGITLVLPKGTCGNTVHRLITNIERYLDPSMEVYIGDINYTQLLRDTLMSTLPN